MMDRRLRLNNNSAFPTIAKPEDIGQALRHDVVHVSMLLHALRIGGVVPIEVAGEFFLLAASRGANQFFEDIERYSSPSPLCYRFFPEQEELRLEVHAVAPSAVVAEVNPRPEPELLQFVRLLLQQAQIMPKGWLYPLPAHIVAQQTDLKFLTPQQFNCYLQHKDDLVAENSVFIPLPQKVNAEITAFRTIFTDETHAALSFSGKNNQVEQPLLVRIHSACFTGDIFHSLRCDCGAQLESAINMMAEAGGIILYLMQEGRGIGLANKLHAYQLQDRGLDTYQANQQIGFPEDARDYALAAHMLQKMGITDIRLLTNNPDKVAKLQKLGINVAERVGIVIAATPENRDYLASKQKKSGHFLGQDV
ncbi:MAG: GTP cyclohydrolase II [Alphaproteobacteria bacterium]